MDWNKIFTKDTSDKGLLPQIDKVLLTCNNKKINNLIKKGANDPNRHLTKEDIWMANKHMKDAIHHLSSGKRNENNRDTTTRLLERPSSRTRGNVNCWRGGGAQGLIHCCKRVQPHSVGTQFGGFLQNEIHSYHTIQQLCSSVFTQRN